MRSLWTSDEILFVKRNLRLCDQEIAEKLGRTKSGVAGIRKRFNLTKKLEKNKILNSENQLSLMLRFNNACDRLTNSIDSILYQLHRLQ